MRCVTCQTATRDVESCVFPRLGERDLLADRERERDRDREREREIEIERGKERQMFVFQDQLLQLGGPESSRFPFGSSSQAAELVEFTMSMLGVEHLRVSKEPKDPDRSHRRIRHPHRGPPAFGDPR